MGWDQRIGVASAQQADFKGAFPANVIESWNLRGVGYKYLAYFFYRATIPFFDYQDKTHFEIGFKLFLSAFILLILGLSIAISRRTLIRYGVDIYSAFFIGGISFFTVSHHASFQAEDMTALIFVLGTACSISDSKILNLTAGFLLGLLFTLKGVTIILGISALVFIFLSEKDRYDKMSRVGLSYVVSSIVILVGIFLFMPSEIRDLQEATIFQSSFDRSLVTRLIILVRFFRINFEHNPILAPGVMAGLVICFYLFRKRYFKTLIAYSLLWVFPAMVVVIQGMGYGYHYSVMIPVAMGSIMAVLLIIRDLELDAKWYAAVYLLPVMFGILCTSPLAIFQSSAVAPYVKTSGHDHDTYATIQQTFTLTEQPEILYLADGTFTYYFESPSYLRHYYPLSLQRSKGNRDLIKMEVHQNALKRAMSYNGEFILLHHNWFDLEQFPALQEKIRHQYCTVYKEDSVTRPITVFRKNKPNSRCQ